MKPVFLTLLLSVATVFTSYAQKSVKALLWDESADEPIAFATVSLTKPGQAKAYKYVLSNDRGEVNVEAVKSGVYVFKAEMLGYIAYTQEIKMEGKEIDLGKIALKLDQQQLDAARVSALGNPVIIKKDTIEYNATSFKTTENDVLEDLLKKLPGVEVSEDGSITVNGQTIKKITIDGKTFFLDDPQLASKNIPAKIVNKLKVIDKKSEQAEFTGIDDGQEETIIDLSIKPGMMNGSFGNVMAGVGHDLLSASERAASSEIPNDTRYQGAAFAGKFTDKTQLSFIFNGNNTNNRGFNDLAGSMMQGMRGGGGGMGRGQGGWGGGNGITTSWMTGANAASTFFDDMMNLGGNYLYNYSNKDVMEHSTKTTYLDEERRLIYDNDGSSNTHSGGHRFGVRLEHKFSENTSILFEPQVNFGMGGFKDITEYHTLNEYGVVRDTANVGYSDNFGNNHNVSTSGFLLFRQRLGKPGRTLTLNTRYSFSNNVLNSWNSSTTIQFLEGERSDIRSIDHKVESSSRSSSINATLTYTEPLTQNLFLEGNYSYSWSSSSSDKNTYDNGTKQLDYAYTNGIINLYRRHTAGVNLMYQVQKFSVQAGLAVIPTYTYNYTKKYDALGEPQSNSPYESTVVNWSPRLMFFGDFNDSFSGRLFYYGNSSQPSTSQLMPVPDISNPLAISFGNPYLQPYFSHSVRGNLRYSNKEKFSSLNFRFNGGFTQDPIVSALWYGRSGEQYTMPFNGPTSANLGANVFFNTPFGKSPFSISNMTRVNWSTNSSYVGKDIDTQRFGDPTEDYYGFMENFLRECDYNIENFSGFTRNTTENVGITERIRLTYRGDALELNLGARTRVNRSWYTIADQADNTTTWNNSVEASVVWNWERIGFSLKGDGSYNWYRGYSSAQPSQMVLNAEIAQMLFKKKFTLALKAYDILGQSKNLTVSDASNYHMESINNTLGRYIVLSLTYRFGNFNGSGHPRGVHGGGGHPGGRPPRM